MSTSTPDSVLIRLIRSVSAIKGSRKATEVILATGGELLEVQAQSDIQAILASEFWRLLQRKQDKALAAMDGAESMAASAIAHQVSSLRSAIDSASLVFMHAVLEDVLLQCILGTMVADPAAWEAQLATRQLRLGEIKGKTYDEILQHLLDKHTTQIEHESLTRKAQCLVGILQPSHEELSDGEYVYSAERLEGITSIRNGVVHETGARAIPTIEEDLRYLEATAFRFLTTTALRYKDEALFERLLRLPVGKPSG